MFRFSSAPQLQENIRSGRVKKTKIAYRILVGKENRGRKVWTDSAPRTASSWFLAVSGARTRSCAFLIATLNMGLVPRATALSFFLRNVFVEVNQGTLSGA